ncbi:transposase [Microbacterium amylolyticum]|uniref:transposase n=1 Tax=Microbacterium amylolyticum TaxID=936337 RepID=UPI0013ECCA22
MVREGARRTGQRRRRSLRLFRHSDRRARLLTGSAWRDLPERFGNWNTIYKNFRRWASDGVWDDLLTHSTRSTSPDAAVHAGVPTA